MWLFRPLLFLDCFTGPWSYEVRLTGCVHPSCPTPLLLLFLRVNLFIHDGHFLFHFCTFLFLDCLCILFLYSFCWIVHFLMIWRLPFRFILFFLHSTVYAFAKNTVQFFGILFSFCFEYPISMRSNFMECLPGSEFLLLLLLYSFCVCFICVNPRCEYIYRLINNELISTNQSATTGNE